MMPSLFPELETELAPQAARLAPKLKTLAERGIFFGTSSWKYPGWAGSIYNPELYSYRGKVAKTRLEENCLPEYARVFPTVGGDFSFYKFPTQDSWDGLFAQVPEHFTFGLKAPQNITASSWPNHPQYGERAGTVNDHFLNAKAFDAHFLKPLAPHKRHVSVVMIEFGTFNKSTFATPADFMAAVDPFLAALPDGFRYGIELRNPEYLSPEYFELLRVHNVAHVFNAWQRMPALDQQARIEEAYTADFSAVRALLKPSRSYQEAKDTFMPYDRT